jgi:hypothetical protein
MNSSGGVSLSCRLSTGHSLPIVSQDLNQKIIHVPVDIQPPAWAKTYFSFARPINLGDVSILSDTVFIYAMSNRDPTSKDDPSSAFHRHDDYGLISNVDFTIADNDIHQAENDIPSLTVIDGTSHCIDENFCVYGRFDSSKSEITYTVHAAADGWASIGFGTDMAGNYMVLICNRQ